jgi:hypothetical protein
MNSTDKWIRKATLTAGIDGGTLDLSEMRFRFEIRRSDIQTPNTADIRIYNLNDNTANRLKGATRITLQAGYQSGPFGAIFQGDVIQVRRGRETPVDTYVDILAAEGDRAYNFGVVNFTLAAGSTSRERIEAVAKAMGLKVGYLPDDLPEQRLPRGRVFYGMGRDALYWLAESAGCTWSIQGDVLEFIPLLTGYIPGPAVELTSETGMIGLPTQTPGGIEVTALIDSNIRTGRLVHINNTSIQRARINPSISQEAVKKNETLPKVTDDGFYRVLAVDFMGDTRGQDWYSHLTCVGMKEPIPISMIGVGV